MADDAAPLTDNVRLLLLRSKSAANRLQLAEPGPAHMLMAMAESPKSFASYLLEHIGIKVDELRDTIEVIHHEYTPPAACFADMQTLIAQARLIESRLAESFIGTEHVLLAALQLADPIVLLAIERLGVPSLQTAIARIETHIHEMTQAGVQACLRNIAASENPYKSPQGHPPELRRAPVTPAGWKRTFGFVLGLIAIPFFTSPAIGILSGMIVRPPRDWRWIQGAVDFAAPMYAIGLVCAVLAALLWRKRG